MAGSDRAIKGHHLLYLSSAWCVCALTEVNEFMNVWRGVRETQRENTVLFTVYELCLPFMVSCIACLLLGKRLTKVDGREGRRTAGRQ